MPVLVYLYIYEQNQQNVLKFYYFFPVSSKLFDFVGNVCNFYKCLVSDA